MTQITTIVCGHSPRADILECDVKWALGTITMNEASGGDLFKIDELFKILKR